jgi:hypothetical protein
VTDIDPAVRDVLDRAVPAPERPASWDDVLRRAELAGALDGARVGEPTRLSRRGWYAVALAVAAGAVLVVNPAFGVGDRVLDLFRGSPAPPEVRQSLREFDPPPEVADLFGGPGVIEEEARGVIELQTSLGPARLWAAPTEAGGWCMAVEGPSVRDDSGFATSGGSATCNAVGGPPLPLEYGLSGHGEGGAAITLLEGHARADVASLAIEFGDGTTTPVEIVDGFFLFELPRDREPTVLVARNAEGKVIERSDLSFGPPAGEEVTPTPTTRRTRKLFEIETRSGTATMWREEPAPRGERCYAIEYSSSEGGACGRGALHQGLVPTLNPTEPITVLLAGSVAPRVATVELRFEDGEVAQLPLVDGFFLFEVAPEHWKKGSLPASVVARDERGRVVARQRVERRYF